MTIKLAEAVRIAKQEAQKRDLFLGESCAETPEGWYFSFIDKKGLIIPGVAGPKVSREGLLLEREFRGLPPAPLKNCHRIDISEYLR